MFEKIIVSREPVVVQWLRQGYMQLQDVPVLQTATPDDVRGKVVYGTVPYDVAAAAEAVVAILYRTGAPQGTDWSIETFLACEPYCCAYIVADL